MRRSLSVFFVLIILLSTLSIGYSLGVHQSDKQWSPRFDAQSESFRSEMDQMLMSTERAAYDVALMNTRSCVLALDSAFMRFIVHGGDSNTEELRTRRSSCRRLWETAASLLPDDGNPDRADALEDARWEFWTWQHQLTTVMQIKPQIIQNQERGLKSPKLWKRLISEMYTIRNYRDSIDRLIYKAI